MERPFLSFTYKGSIADAIIEAQSTKKLFVVYISGDDDVSTSMEGSIWEDQRVAETISKHCVFLHLVEGTVDSSQFSAIYPQRSIPSISAVAYNGIMLWQHEGFTTAENLVEGIEKAWASLQLQETAAALLSAALASKKSEPSSSNVNGSLEERTSSTFNAASTGSGETIREVDGSISEMHTRVGEENLSSEDGHATTTPISPGTGARNCVPRHTSTSSGGQSEQEDNPKDGSIKRVTNHSSPLESAVKFDGGKPERGRPQSSIKAEIQGDSKMIFRESERTQEKSVEVSSRPSNSIKPAGVHLNIRLPDGTYLQMRFSLSDTLQSVKTYIDEHTASDGGVYDLAIPYPRKVFVEQDMFRTMLELGFTSREALIVVPHQHLTVARRVQSPSSTNAVNGSDNDDSGNGYFAFAKRMLSYVNPFTYLGGASDQSDPQPGPGDLQQQGRTPYWSNQSVAAQSHRPSAPTERGTQSRNNANMSGERTSNRFGGNFHTLRDIEREGRSSDRNVFWNGNSTQFGGDDDKN